MKKIVFLTSLICITIFHATIFSMDDEENQLYEVVSDSTTPLQKGDHIVLKKKFKKIEQTIQEELPPVSLGCNILGWVGKGTLCLVTSAAAIAGEYLTVVFINNQNDNNQEDSSTAIMAGTTVGMGICALGLCVYGCSVALTNGCRNKQAQKKRKVMHFVVEEKEI